MKKQARFGIQALMVVVAAMLAPVMASAAVISIDDTHNYEDVGFLSGTAGVTNAFDVALAGSYRATLTDFKFPDAFQALQLIVTSSTQEYGRITSPGSFLFDATPGRYYVSVTGDAGDAFDLGLYGVWIGAALDAPPAPVALPEAGLLMASALGLLTLMRLRRRGGDDSYVASLAPA